MTRCSYWDLDDDNKYWRCENEANGWQNCGFDGAGLDFCDEHNCRCKKRTIDDTERCVQRGEE